MKKLTGMIAAFALGGLMLSAAPEAYAVSCGTSAGLDTSNVTINSVGGSSVPTIEATNCAGAFTGNDTGTGGTLIADLNGGLFAGLTNDWSLFGKSDQTGSGVTATIGTTGTWNVDFSPNIYAVFAISLKGATSWAVYLFDLRPNANSLYGGGYSMTGLLNNGGNIPDLSHISVAKWEGPGCCDNNTDVPLPAAGFLLLGALGALGGLGAYRRRQTAV